MAVLPMPFVFWGSPDLPAPLGPPLCQRAGAGGDTQRPTLQQPGGIATIKSFTAEAHESARIGGLSDEYRQRNRAAIVLSSAFVPLIRMVIVVGFYLHPGLWRTTGDHRSTERGRL